MKYINFRVFEAKHTCAYFLISVLGLHSAWTQKSFSESLDHEGTTYKLSTGLYNITEPKMASQMGEDVNLRASSAIGNAWLGIYQAQDKTFSQTRMGWDSSYDLGRLRVQPSVQSAAGGFLGGSVGIETGERVFMGVGLGRTNLKNYFNLNFDPNDAWSASTGYRWSAQKFISLQIVHDNREHPDQQHVHLVYRTPFFESDRFLIDLLYKSGSVENQFIRKYGLMTGVDWGPLGLRFAYDPKVNFSNADMKRLIVSYRY